MTCKPPVLAADPGEEPRWLVEDRAAAPLVAACSGDRDLARAAWATIKGLVDLELAARSPPDTDLDAVYASAARAYAGVPARPSD